MIILWSTLMLLVALVAGLFGFGGPATEITEPAQMLCFASIGLFAVLVLTGALRRDGKDL